MPFAFNIYFLSSNKKKLQLKGYYELGSATPTACFHGSLSEMEQSRDSQFRFKVVTFTVALKTLIVLPDCVGYSFF